MLMDIQVFLVSIISIAGALFAAVLGWLDSGEPFAPRKFASSVLRAVTAGIVFAVTTYAGVDTILSGWVYVFAFLGGAGIDVLGNRASGAMAARSVTKTQIADTAVADFSEKLNALQKELEDLKKTKA